MLSSRYKHFRATPAKKGRWSGGFWRASVAIVFVADIKPVYLRRSLYFRTVFVIMAVPAVAI
jgi:hypothetical protein